MSKVANTTWGERMSMVSARYGSPREFSELTGIAEDRVRELFAGAEPTYPELRSIVDKTDLDGTWLVTGDGHYLRGTAAAQRFMGLTKQLSQFLAEIGMPSKPEDVTAIVRTMLMAEEARTVEKVKTKHH